MKTHWNMFQTLKSATPFIIFYLFVISESATIKQTFNDSASVLSARTGRSNTGGRRGNRYTIGSPGNNNLKPENSDDRGGNDGLSNVEKRCTKCVYYNPPTSRDPRERYGGGYDYYGRGYEDEGYDRRDYYDRGRDNSRRPDYYDRSNLRTFGEADDNENRYQHKEKDYYPKTPETTGRYDGGYDGGGPYGDIYDRGSYKGGYDSGGYPSSGRGGSYDRGDYYKGSGNIYNDGYGRPGYNRDNFDHGYDRGGQDYDRGSYLKGGYDRGIYDRGNYGHSDYDYGNNDGRNYGDDRYGYRRGGNDDGGYRRYRGDGTRRDDYLGNDDYDREGYRPWDETTRGSSGWDNRGRGYYFATGKPEYDSGYAGGWPYGGGEGGYGTGGGRRRWQQDDEGYRRRTSYLHDRDESQSSPLPTQQSNDTKSTGNRNDEKMNKDGNNEKS